MSLVSSHSPASYSAMPTNHCCVCVSVHTRGAGAGRSAALGRSEREGPRSWRRLLTNHIITKERTIEDGEERREGGGGGGGGKRGEKEEERRRKRWRKRRGRVEEEEFEVLVFRRR